MVEPKRVSHCMEMPSRIGLARSALKLISPQALDLYTPFLAGRTVACTKEYGGHNDLHSLSKELRTGKVLNLMLASMTFCTLSCAS